MTDLEKIIDGEDIEYEIEYQVFDANSTSSDIKGTLYEFTLTTENQEIFDVRVFQNSKDSSISYISSEEKTFGNPIDVLTNIESDEEDFKYNVVGWAKDIITKLENN